VKLKINGKYEDVGYFSFMKCYLLSYLGLGLIMFLIYLGLLFLIFLISFLV